MEQTVYEGSRAVRKRKTEGTEKIDRNCGKTQTDRQPHFLQDAQILEMSKAVFLNRRAAARYRALASIIPGRKRFS